LLRGWDDTGGVFGAPDFKIVAFDGHLLENEALCGFIRSSEINEGVVAVARDPSANDRVSVLEDVVSFTKVLEGFVQVLDELVRGHV
jgi:hypothetical protein